MLPPRKIVGKPLGDRLSDLFLPIEFQLACLFLSQNVCQGVHIMRRVLPAALLAATMLSSPAWAGWTQTVTDVSMANQPQAYLVPPGEQALVGPFTLNGRTWDLAWCLDLYGSISLGAGQNITYQVNNFSDTGYATIKKMGNTQQGIDKQHLIAGLMQKGDNLLWPGGISNPSDVGEAIQLAIWSVEYDGFTFSGASDAVVALMNGYITEAPTSNHGLVAYDGESHQTLGKIPEPMTITILGVGMLGLGLARKRR
jgi:hypothetical protein